MADPLPAPDSPDRVGGAPGTPLWVKVSGIVVVLVVVLFVVVMLTGGISGGHGPGRHAAPPSMAAPGDPQP